MEKEDLRKGVVAPLLVSALSFGAFLRMPGPGNVRAVKSRHFLVAGWGWASLWRA